MAGMNLRHHGLSFIVLTGAAAVCSAFACDVSPPLPARGPEPLPLTAPGPEPPLRPVLPLGPLSLYDGPHNGLHPAALWRSPKLLEFLRTWKQPLTTASLAMTDSLAFNLALNELYANDSPPVCGSRTDSCASKLMGYIVSCALDSGTSVELKPPGKSPLAWSGELGLCGNRAAVKDRWSSSAPTDLCLQAVSACVLARVNALDLRVAISLRGESSVALAPLRDKVRIEKTLREKDGTETIASLDTTCPAGTPSGDPHRNCGWDRRYVGRCENGATVTLKTVPSGTTASDTMVRVCKGIHACDDAPAPAPYAGLVVDVPSAERPFSFKCPSPSAGRQYSYFGVMVAAKNPVAPLPGPSVDVIPEPGTLSSYGYPSKEEEVFTFREGAFYGNIFEKPTPPPTPSEGGEPPSLFGEQYACYGSIWHDGVAAFTGRMCARNSTAGLCFGNYPYPCLDRMAPPPPLSNSCARESGGPAGSYLECKGFKGSFPAPTPTLTSVWPYGLTVLLNDPCDLSSAQGCNFPR